MLVNFAERRGGGRGGRGGGRGGRGGGGRGGMLCCCEFHI